MKWPWKKSEPEHEAVGERLDTVEEEMKTMAHRILLLEVELGLYDEGQSSENKQGG